MLRKLIPVILALAPATLAHAQTGGTYDLTWNVVSCGGGTSTGGTYSLSGTIGQADTGPGVAGMTGAQYVLLGGFWPGSRPFCPADFNNSGAVTVQDIFDFLSAYFSNDPRADFNHSGAISVQDIFDFLAEYFASC